jgi:GNAT superfamily N-acetyltransferase
MEVREARPEDAQEACAVLRRSIVELCAADHGHDSKLFAAWLANKTPEDFVAWMERADASYLLAINGGLIAAVGAVGDDGEILLNYVSPDARFLGASRVLLAALERRATERGAKQCTLISTETARRFYRARGFQETGAGSKIRHGVRLSDGEGVGAAGLRQRPGRVYGVAGMESRSLPAERVVDAIVLRPLTVSDAEIASEVIRSAFADQPRPTRPPSSALRETASSIASKIEAGGGFGAWAGARLVALALWQVAGDTLHIARVSVLPERRGERLSRRLLGRCEDAARARGLSRMTLRVRLELPENERLFERFGFRRVRVETHEDFDRPTTSVMEKELS